MASSAHIHEATRRTVAYQQLLNEREKEKERRKGAALTTSPRAAAAEAAIHGQAQPERQKVPKLVEVYVCPTPGCLDYYGAAGMGDLAVKQASPKTEHVSAHEDRTGQRTLHSRAQCPTCRTAGQEVERVLVQVRVMV